MLTAITNAHVFDGERVIDDQVVVIDGAHIQAVGGVAPAGATVIDARGATLMPGLIDAHVHTDMDGLRDALLFCVTTELEMMGCWTDQERKEVAEHDDIADVRSPGMGITPPGGHPTEYMPNSDDERMRDYAFPFVSGNQFSLTIECSSNKEADASKLSTGGKATHPMKDEFFGYYGDLTDRFGINWMISHMKPQS
jgi:hypothetical protein